MREPERPANCRAGWATGLVIVAAALPGCDSSDTRVTLPVTRPVEITAIADDAAAGLAFENVTDFLFDGQRLWILDKGAHRLLVFNERGMLRQTVGRRGAGPGEFVNPIAIALRNSNEVWVVDAGAARFTVFDTSGDFLSSYRRQSGDPSMPWPGRILADGRILEVRWHPAPGGGGKSWLVWHTVTDESLPPVDSIALELPDIEVAQFTANTPAGRLAAQVPFSPSVQHAIDPTGRIWVASGDAPVLTLGRIDGGTSYSVELPIQRHPVTEGDRAEAVASLDWFVSQGGVVELDRIPVGRPYLDGILTAPTRGAWIRLTDRDWLIVDTSGVAVARVDLKLETFPPPRLSDSVIVGLTRDSLDRPTVRVYRW